MKRFFALALGVAALTISMTSFAFAAEDGVAAASEAADFKLTGLTSDAGQEFPVRTTVELQPQVEDADAALEYKYVWMKDNWKEWGVLQSWTTDSSFEWTPVKAGTYTLYVDVRDSSGLTKTTFSHFVVASPSLKIGVSSPQEYAKGMVIPMEVVASPDEDCEYKIVWMKDNWKKWGVVRDFSSDRALEWVPGESGDYVLYLDVSDSGGKDLETVTTKFSVAETWQKQSFSAQSSSAALPGNEVTLAFQATGNKANLSYKFVWMKDNWKEWGVVRDFASDPTCTWTPASAGTYALYVDVQNSSGAIKSFQTTYTVGKMGLIADVPSGSAFAKGMEITVQAQVGANSGYTGYKFVWMKDNWKEWGVIRNFDSSSIATWKPAESGIYTIFVDAKDAEGRVISESISYELTEEWALESFTALVSEPPMMSHGLEIDLSVVTNGNNANLTYKFVWMKDNWKEWGVIGGETTDTVCSWPVPGPGTYTLYVDITNSAGVQKSYTMELFVDKAWRWDGKGVKFSAGSQEAGETVQISAAIEGDTSGLRYKFVWMKDNWREWGVIQDLSEYDTCEWTPAEAGDYTIYVDVCDAAGVTESTTAVYKAWEFLGVKTPVHYTGTSASECKVIVTPNMGCTDPDGMEYKYTVATADGSEVLASCDWTTTYGFEWVPEEFGTYSFTVEVRLPDGEIVADTLVKEITADPNEGRFLSISSKTKYLIIVDCTKNKVTIYEGEKDNWSVVKYWDCATGAPGTPTVKGYYTIGYRGYYFDAGNERLFYWTQFYGDYLFHSTTYYQYPTPSHPFDDRVGLGLSHGCVRLKLENAKWIYDNIPQNTQVYVF